MRPILATAVLMVGIVGPQMVSAQEETRARIVCVEAPFLPDDHTKRTMVIDQISTEYDNGTGIKHMQGIELAPEGNMPWRAGPLTGYGFQGKSPIFEGRMRFFEGALDAEAALDGFEGQLDVNMTIDEANAFIENATPEEGKDWDGKFGRIGSTIHFFYGSKIESSGERWDQYAEDNSETDAVFINFSVNTAFLNIGSMHEKTYKGYGYTDYHTFHCMLPYVIPAPLPPSE